jgi:hypothetical protein
VRNQLTPTLAFVSGRASVALPGRFSNVGVSFGGPAIACYYGANFFSEGGADVVSISSRNDMGTYIGINLQGGLLLQPDPHLALSLRSGYAAAIGIANGGWTEVEHFIPISFEAVVPLVPVLDIGASVLVGGYVGQSGSSSQGRGVLYFGLRAGVAFIRARL